VNSASMLFEDKLLAYFKAHPDVAAKVSAASKTE
jgi:hypothetical protein